MDRSEYVANRKYSVLLIIDFQQAMLKAVDSWEMIADKVMQLIRSANALDVPILLTEQYKKGLGETIPGLIKEIKSPQVFQKEHSAPVWRTASFLMFNPSMVTRSQWWGWKPMCASCKRAWISSSQAFTCTWWPTQWHPV
jgi:hypothetical protein